MADIYEIVKVMNISQKIEYLKSITTNDKKSDNNYLTYNALKI